MALLVRDPLASRTELVSLPAEGGSVRSLLRTRCEVQGFQEEHFYVKCNGRCVDPEDVLQDGAVYSLEPKLCGGKGGFGSMLRALGAQIEKTTNREACRDLSGRRLRDVNHEKAMAEWVKQQAEREAEKEQRRLERLKRKLAEPKHFFTNPDYQQQCHEMAERLEDSVLKGMQASSSKVVSPESCESEKCPHESENEMPFEKKRCLWLGVEGLDDPDSSPDSSDSEGDESPNSSKSYKTSTSSYCKMAPSTGQRPGGSEDSISCNSVSDTAEKSYKEMEPAEKDLVEDFPTGETAADENHEAAKTLMDLEQANSSCQQAVSQLPDPGNATINLQEYKSVTELEALGLEKLKLELMARGLKCGGTLQERAARLFSVRGLPRSEIDPALFAKPSKGKKK
ncbi:splicing regulator SDE2 [Eublepharis macularius]|uniref:Replication stress response regulator SDE2 n=1 Tax=Eublepharis macularius TaxID=481883 RepID=A0AA97LEP0_EUBMA|nr:splicing regulator SDE2 [Eublepharis macularius]